MREHLLCIIKRRKSDFHPSTIQQIVRALLVKDTNRSMPRGWLKHKERRVGKKASRGGSSARCDRKQRSLLHNKKPSNVNGRKHTAAREVEYASWRDEDLCVHDERKCAILHKNNKSDYSSDRSKDEIVHECSICCELRPLVSLLRNCSHPPSCRTCLREMFVIQAQDNVSNYPLICYHPSCGISVKDTQLIRHNLVRSEEELRKHYKITVLLKAYTDAKRNKIVHCPKGDCHWVVKIIKSVESNHFTHCNQCGTLFVVAHEGITNEFTTISALESLKNDKFGENDDWTTCPKCDIIISKGSGCNHMRCHCGFSFSWSFVQRKKEGRKMAYAKSLDKE